MNEQNHTTCLNCKQPKTRMVRLDDEGKPMGRNDFYVCTNKNCFMKIDITKIKNWKIYGQLSKASRMAQR